MDRYGPHTYGDAFADVYDEWYGNVSDVEGTVRVVSTLAAGGAVLELGIGTGRLALPLAAAGVEVHGVDSSEAMIERLRAKPGGEAIPVTVADMAELPVPEPGRFAVVLAAFNTFFNLSSADAQRACLGRVADALVSDGRLVIEAFLPSEAPPEPEGTLEVRGVDLGSVRLTATWRDPGTQTVAGQHVEITEAGIRMRPWMIRYASPAELDEMCAAVGLWLEDRWADWSEAGFDPAGERHVSIYRVGARS